MSCRFCRLVMLALLIAVPLRLANADDVGRYQMVPIPKAPNEPGDRVMILDTTTGDLWQWWEAPRTGQYGGGDGLTYMGRVAPGSRPGETRTFRRFSLPTK
jgi:hypothetical protein